MFATMRHFPAEGEPTVARDSLRVVCHGRGWFDGKPFEDKCSRLWPTEGMLSDHAMNQLRRGARQPSIRYTGTSAISPALFLTLWLDTPCAFTIQ